MATGSFIGYALHFVHSMLQYFDLQKDGQGLNGGVTKPDPMMQYVIYAVFILHLNLLPTFSASRSRALGRYGRNSARRWPAENDFLRVQNVKVLNSPARAYSVANTAALVMSNLIVDNCMCFRSDGLRRVPYYI